MLPLEAPDHIAEAIARAAAADALVSRGVPPGVPRATDDLAR
jgi:hypothetical protein